MSGPNHGVESVDLPFAVGTLPIEPARLTVISRCWPLLELKRHSANHVQSTANSLQSANGQRRKHALSIKKLNRDEICDERLMHRQAAAGALMVSCLE
jgi:hypothetical protein